MQAQKAAPYMLDPISVTSAIRLRAIDPSLDTLHRYMRHFAKGRCGLSQLTILLEKAAARNFGYCYPPSRKRSVRFPSQSRHSRVDSRASKSVIRKEEPASVCGRPAGYRGFLRDLFAQVQVLPCVRPVDAAIITAAGLSGDRGSGPDRSCALEALGHIPGFPNPVSDRCAIPL